MFWCGASLLEVEAFVTLINTMAKQTQQLTLMLIIGILIGTTAVMAWKMRNASQDQDSGKEMVESTPRGATTTLEGANMTNTTTISQSATWPLSPEIPANTRIGIIVADQPAGNSVAVSGLSLSEAKWVGVYDDRDGHPGFIMGAVRVRAGDTLASVDLLRPTTPQAKYYAVILNDDGDTAFNRLTDLPPLSPDKVVIVSFLAK